MRWATFAGVFLVSICAAHDARAQMRDEMHAYFEGEAAGSWGFATAGVVSLAGAGTGLWAAEDRLYRGAAYPLAVFGLVQLGAGLVLGLRTHGQIVERDRWLNEGSFWNQEAPRMEGVRRQFHWLEVAEIGLALAGSGIAAYGSAKHDHLVAGIGLGLAFEAGAMLVMDQIADDRAAQYVRAMDQYRR